MGLVCNQINKKIKNRDGFVVKESTFIPYQTSCSVSCWKQQQWHLQKDWFFFQTQLKTLYLYKRWRRKKLTWTQTNSFVMMKPVDGLMKLVKTTISSVFIIKNIEKEWSFCYFLFLTCQSFWATEDGKEMCVYLKKKEAWE